MAAIAFKKLQNGSDIRGVALEGIEGQPVNLTEEAVTTKMCIRDRKRVPPLVGRFGIGSLPGSGRLYPSFRHRWRGTAGFFPRPNEKAAPGNGYDSVPGRFYDRLA